MAREKVTFEKRIQVMLDRDEAKEMPSRDGGTEYMRVLDNDQRIMFCPSALEAEIQASGAKAGDLISIDKLQVKRGRETQTVWEVAIIGDQPAAPAPPRRRATLAPTPARPAAPQPAASDRDTAAQAAAMASAFRAAILATGDAEQHAAAVGLRDLVLSDRDTITRVALSIYIQGGKA